MPIELKDVLIPLGFAETDIEKLTPDDFKKTVDEKYILRDAVLKDEDIKKKITGNAFGKINTKLAQDLGLTSGEIKDKSIEEIVGLYKTKVTAEIEALKLEGGKNNDKKVEDLTKKLGEYEGLLKTKDDGLKEWETKYTTDLGEKDKSLKSFKLNSVIGKIKEALAPKFTEEYTKNELVRTGFEAHINNKYIFELDEADKPVVKLRADNSFVKSKKTIGHNATPEEVFELEMDANGVLKKNNATDKKVITTFVAKQNQIEGQEKSKVHPNAAKNLARLQEQKEKG